MSSVINFEGLAIEGFKKQANGLYFARVKIPAGVFSSEQACQIAAVTEKFSGEDMHLTIRGNIEIRNLSVEAITEVYRRLKSVGLELRGAMGPGVRAVACGSFLSENFYRCQALAAKIQHYFSGNPHFEGVPKKFKIGVEGCYQDVCHLIQDVCLVYSGESAGEKTYDVWLGGGLGRHPVEAFLYCRHLPERRVIPLIESVLEIYMNKGKAGQRLKTLIHQEGRERFVEELDKKTRDRESLPLAAAFDQHLTAVSTQPGRGKLVVPVPFGQISAADLKTLADLARVYSDGYLVVTPNQNIALFISSPEKDMVAMKNLESAGFLDRERMRQINFRTCPGTHECARGLIATREVGAEIIAHLTDKGRALKVSLSGCGNACPRPQTADFGIVTSKKEPRFDVYRRHGESFGKLLHKGLDLEELLKVIEEIN